MKKHITLLLCIALLGNFSGCAAHPKKAITVISREEGSGTRGAFVETLGIAENGVDCTVDTAEITNSTAVVTQTVMIDPFAIGYISFGALNDAVRAVSVDGVFPSLEEIKAGHYPLSRPFSLCYRPERLTALGQDFITYLLSDQGQQILADEGYIPAAEQAPPYTGSSVTGILSLSGSTSVAAVMEVLAERYRTIHPGVTIDIQQTGSGAGILAAIGGSCEIGMTSRPLQDQELSAGLTETQLALDGIAVIVHPENHHSGLTSQEIRGIFTGEITSWSQLD